jgi:hypothetical protein
MKPPMKVLAEGDITVTLSDDGTSGTITSTLKEENSREVGNDPEYEAAIDGMESLILALACQGYGIELRAFGRAVQTTIDAIVNNT